MLNSRDLADRQIIAAIREYRALDKRRYTITKLEKPVQRGWRRFYALSGRATTRVDRPILEAIIGVIGSVTVHHSRDFRRRRGRSKKLLEIEQPLRPIPVYEWERKNYPNEWFRYFRYQLLLEWNRHWQPYWVFTQPSLYELKVERNWLWHFREVDPAIETRLSELDRWLEAREGRLRYDWLKGRRQSRWRCSDDARQRSLADEHKREIALAYENSPEVDPVVSAGRIPVSFWRTPL